MNTMTVNYKYVNSAVKIVNNALSINVWNVLTLLLLLMLIISRIVFKDPALRIVRFVMIKSAYNALIMIMK